MPTPIEVSVWPAPAKINLFLHINGRRSDGYHLLQTVFQLVDLCDEIQIELCRSGTITCRSSLSGLPEHQDLAWRAARLLQQRTGSDWGARIEVQKRIPAGAGLGGGSSDAATVLLALNELWQTALSLDELAGLGLALGADVPVFVRGFSAWAQGVGEMLTPIQTAPMYYVVVFPNENIATSEIFTDPALTRDTPQTTIPRFVSGELTRNDLQAPVLRRYPRVAAALQWLSQFGSARMSGSGASVFAAFNERAQAESVAQQCTDDWQVFVTQGVLCSPLHQALNTWRSRAQQSGQA